MSLAVRQDTQSDFGADGDYVPMSINADGEVRTAVTNAGLTELAAAINSSRVDVNIAAGGFDGAVTNAGTFAVQSTLQAGSAAIGKLAANTGVDIGDVDVTSVIPGVGATNLGKAEDAAHSSGDVGVMALAVRQDSQSDLGADGDYVPLTINADGELRVTTGSGGSGGDLTARTTIGSSGTSTNILCDSDGHLKVDVVSAASSAVTNAGTFAVQSTLQAGSAAIGKLAANTGVDIGDVDVTSIVPGTGATNLGKAEDASHSSGDVGVMALAVRNDSLAALGGADGDYAPLQVNASGAVFVEATAKKTAPSILINNASFASGQTSATIDTLGYRHCNIYMQSASTHMINVQYSNNDSNWISIANKTINFMTINSLKCGFILLENTPRYVRIANYSGSSHSNLYVWHALVD